MPRLTPCRISKLVLFVWLFMMWLWFALPSPTISLLERDSHIRKTLASGRPLITVHDWDKSFNRQDNGQMGPGSALVVRWQLVTMSNQEVSLKIGDTASINLAEIIANGQELNVGEGKKDQKAWLPYVSKMIRIDDIWASDIEFSVVCLSWFHSADKHLITHEMHGLTASMAVHFRMPERGVLELWKAAVLQTHWNEDGPRLRDDTLPVDVRYANMYQDGWEMLDEDMRKFGLLSRFKIEDIKQVDGIDVEGMQGDLLSTTYPVRRVLLGLLQLPLVVILALFDTIRSLLPGIFFLCLEAGLTCGGIMLSCWIRDGRPDFKEWTKTFWMTRRIPRMSRTKRRGIIWGPAGPVAAEGAKEGSWDEENGWGLQRPKTVRSGRGNKKT